MELIVCKSTHPGSCAKTALIACVHLKFMSGDNYFKIVILMKEIVFIKLDTSCSTLKSSEYFHQRKGFHYMKMSLPEVV